MTAPHFFVQPEEARDAGTGAFVLLSPADSRHAVRSLRLRPGEEVTLADGTGWWGSGRLAPEREGRAAVQVGETRTLERPKPVITVALAPPKGDRLSWAVQKLAEVGVDRTELIETDRTVRAWTEERWGRVLDRLRGVAREAAMQSRRPFLMEVRRGDAIGAFGGGANPAGGPREATVLLWEGADRPLTKTLPAEPAAIRVIVGPEGGFSEGEVAAALAAGAGAVSLGAAILRTETAALAGAVLVLARYGRLG